LGMRTATSTATDSGAGNMRRRWWRMRRMRRQHHQQEALQGALLSPP